MYPTHNIVNSLAKNQSVIRILIKLLSFVLQYTQYLPFYFPLHSPSTISLLCHFQQFAHVSSKHGFSKVTLFIHLPFVILFGPPYWKRQKRTLHRLGSVGDGFETCASAVAGGFKQSFIRRGILRCDEVGAEYAFHIAAGMRIL